MRAKGGGVEVWKAMRYTMPSSGKFRRVVWWPSAVVLHSLLLRWWWGRTFLRSVSKFLSGCTPSRHILWFVIFCSLFFFDGLHPSVSCRINSTLRIVLIVGGSYCAWEWPTATPRLTHDTKQNTINSTHLGPRAVFKPASLFFPEMQGLIRLLQRGCCL